MISSVGSFKSTLNFYNSSKSNQPSVTSSTLQTQTPDKSKKHFSNKELIGMAALGGMSVFVVGGAIVHGKYKQLSRSNRILSEQNLSLTNRNRDLEQEITNIRRGFDDLFSGGGELRKNLYNSLKQVIDRKQLNYNVMEPPSVSVSYLKDPKAAKPLPEIARTNNRAHFKKLDIPQIAPDGRFEYTLPKTNETKITKSSSKEIAPLKDQVTTISEGYADSVVWDKNKITRDVVQNFFDGHGQTLDGVGFSFKSMGQGRYKVRITGESTYTPDKALLIGESTKRTDNKAAGNYGEGLKVSALKLLKDAGAPEVVFGSDNWKVSYKLGKTALSDNRLLTYSLDKVPHYDGNYMEFETNDRELLECFRKSIDRFYHSGNEHFKCPDVENEILGVKKLKPEEKGGIYISGQRFECNNDFDGLDGTALFIKEKLPVSVLDPSRDRISLTNDKLKDIGTWFEKDGRTSDEDCVNFIKSMEDYWGEVSEDSMKPQDALLKGFLHSHYVRYERPLNIKFPEKCVAYSFTSLDVIEDLMSKGYKICKEDMHYVGMMSIRELLQNGRKHVPVVPTEQQTKKILVMKEALNKLDGLKGRGLLEAEELDTKIYVFNKHNEKDLYEDTLAEAITDNGTSKGFWIDSDYLNNGSFSDVLETALHELSHKAGGDGSASFSYQLTRVNRQAIAQLVNDNKTREEFQALSAIWNELSSNRPR